MAEPRHSRELLDLFNAACSGRLDAASMARLEELLGASDEACALWLAFMQLDADLRVLVATSAAERRALAQLSAAGALPPIAPVPEAHAGHWFHVLLSAPVVVGASLLVLLAVVFWGLFQQPNVDPAGGPLVAQSPEPADSSAMGNLISLVRPPQQVAAMFSSTEDAVWSEGNRYQPGQLLPAGTRLNLLAGLAELSMTSGADVILQSPCTVVLLDDCLVQLEAGTVTVQVAKWATGFVVETRGLKVTDLGTRFAVSAGPSGTAEAHVLDGSILAKPLEPGRAAEAPLLLRTSEAIRVNVREKRVDRFVAQRDRFADKFDNSRPYRPIDLPNTGRGSTIGDEDAHWRVTAGPSSVGPWPQPAIVSLPHSRYSDNAPEKSQWLSVPRGIEKGVPKNTVFTFETTFVLAGVDPATVSVVAQILADNGVKGIRLNGKPVAMEPWVDNVLKHRFQTFHEVEIREGFVAGENRIEMDVFNGISGSDPTSPNPMALRVEWQAFGRGP